MARPSKITSADVRRLVDGHRAGMRRQALADSLGVSKSAVDRALRRDDVRREMARRDRLDAKAEAERQRRARIKIDSFTGMSREALDAARPERQRQPRGGLAETGSVASDFGSRPGSGGAVTGSRRRRSEGGRVLPVIAVDGAYARWLDERDARVPLTRADLHSGNDLEAARAVAAGGGMQAVIEATGLRTLKNVLALIDPAILDQARENDAAPPPAPEPGP